MSRRSNRFSLTAERGGVRRAAYVLLAGIFVYVCLLLADGVDLERRIRLLRLWVVAAVGVFAVLPPHLLLPDANVRLIQRLNWTPGWLLVHQAALWNPVVTLMMVPGLLLAFFDPGDMGAHLVAKSEHMLACLMVVLGAGWYSFRRYVTMGPVSQAWQEGTRGQGWRRLQEHTPMQPMGIPNGLVPAVTATAHVFIVGVLVLVASAYVAAVASALAWLPGGLLLGWVGLRTLARRASFDRSFYSTNAFYEEVFRRAGGARVSDRAPIPYRAVYWAPARWKPSVWASLRQLDRTLPLGRFVALGHVVLWILFFQDASMRTIAVYLMLFIAVKNGTVILLASPSFAPLPFQTVMQSPRAWVATRFLVNLRWTPPFLLSLLLVAAFDPALSASQALLWTGLDVVCALTASYIFTYGTEFQHRRRYA